MQPQRGPSTISWELIDALDDGTVTRIKIGKDVSRRCKYPWQEQKHVKYVKNRKKWGCIFTTQWVHEVSIITSDSIQIIIWVCLNSSLKTAEQEKPDLFMCLIWRFTQILHPTSNMKNKSIQNNNSDHF